jgi:hypothetical protein
MNTRLLWPLCASLLLGCPVDPPGEDGTAVSTDTSSGDGDGDGDPGDGDPGDGDGDGDGDPSGDGDGDGDGDGCLEPSFGADSSNMRWVTFEAWPAWAQFVEPIDLQEAIDAGTLTPVDLGLGVECYELLGSDVHPCVIEVECVELLGYPLLEVPIETSDCAEIGGAWDMTGLAPAFGSGCWGAVDGFAVRLRADAPMCDGPAGDVGCACMVDSCLDGLTCKSDFCSP